jgi:hypothetical protein
MDEPSQPGECLYFNAISGEPQRVTIRDVGECGLAVCFPGRDDCDLLEDVTGVFKTLARAEADDEQVAELKAALDDVRKQARRIGKRRRRAGA